MCEFDVMCRRPLLTSSYKEEYEAAQKERNQQGADNEGDSDVV